MVAELKGYFDEGLFVVKGCLPNNTYTSTKFNALCKFINGMVKENEN